MKPIPWRVQLGAVAACYAAILAWAALMVTQRYLAGLRDPNDYNGGMAAFGDWMLEIFIGMLLLIPTSFLALILRKSEIMYTLFSKILFGLSLTAPVSLGLLLIPAIGQRDTILGSFCFYRLFGAPCVLICLAVSRLLARFRLSKRLLSYGLLTEAVNIVLAVGLLFFAGHSKPIANNTAFRIQNAQYRTW